MSRRRSSPGFTLVEMIVGVLLGSIVLMGVFSIMTNMVSQEVNGMRTGTVTAWSLAGINTMSADIAGASALSYPQPPGQDNNLIVCEKWSTKMNPPVGGEMLGATGSMTIRSYCWDTTDIAPFKNSLLRFVQTHPLGSGETCPTAPLVCNQLTYRANNEFVGGALGNPDTIVATGVYQDAALDPIFTADPNTLNAVRVRFSVGNPAANAVSAGGAPPVGASAGTVTSMPVTISFNTEIILED